MTLFVPVWYDRDNLFFFLLWQEVSDKNRRISMLELEKDALLEQLDELQTHWLITQLLTSVRL